MLNKSFRIILLSKAAIKATNKATFIINVLNFVLFKEKKIIIKCINLITKINPLIIEIQ